MAARSSNDSILSLSVPDVLPGTLLLHRSLGLLVHLSCEQGTPCLLWAQTFTDNELLVLLPLFAWHPDYCPLEVMLAHFLGSPSDTAIERARKQLYAAMDTGEVDLLLRPMRNVLSHARIKLREAGLEIATLVSLGYLLKPVRRRALLTASKGEGSDQRAGVSRVPSAEKLGEEQVRTNR